jgi:plastocyanin
MNKTTTIVLLIVLIAAGGIILFGKKNAQAPATTNTENTVPSGDASGAGGPTSTGPSTTTPIIGGSESVNGNGGLTFNPTGANTVKYTDAGFVPASIDVTPGTTVTFVNDSSGQMWVASDPHPTHTDLPGFDEHTAVSKGGTYTYTFTKVGTWGYHNHVHASAKGTINVLTDK